MLYRFCCGSFMPQVASGFGFQPRVASSSSFPFYNRHRSHTMQPRDGICKQGYRADNTVLLLRLVNVARHRTVPGALELGVADEISWVLYSIRRSVSEPARSSSRLCKTPCTSRNRRNQRRALRCYIQLRLSWPLTNTSGPLRYHLHIARAQRSSEE